MVQSVFLGLYLRWSLLLSGVVSLPPLQELWCRWLSLSSSTLMAFPPSRFFCSACLLLSGLSLVRGPSDLVLWSWRRVAVCSCSWVCNSVRRRDMVCFGGRRRRCCFLTFRLVVAGFLGGGSSRCFVALFLASSSPWTALEHWFVSDLLRSAVFSVVVSLPPRRGVWRMP